MRALAVSTVVVLYGCIDSPTVELVESPDASTNATPAPTDPPPACDPKRCEDARGTCSNDVCTFTCSGERACDHDIRCPSGMPCSIACTGREACNRKVECKESPRCTIACDGDDACKEGVTCNGADCAVTCQNGGCDASNVRCCATSCTLDGVAATCR